MWVIGSIAGVVGLLAVVAALLLEPRDEPARSGGLLAADGLPRPAEVRRLRFPARWSGGYDPAVVDATVADLAHRYEVLYLTAGPSVLAEAERRLAGGDPPTARGARSAEELEDGGSDGAGVLDR